MKRRKFPPALVTFTMTLIFQLISDHIMRTYMDRAPFWFPLVVACTAGLFALTFTKMTFRSWKEPIGK